MILILNCIIYAQSCLVRFLGNYRIKKFSLQINFHLFTPAESVSFLKIEYYRKIKVISVWEHGCMLKKKPLAPPPLFIVPAHYGPNLNKTTSKKLSGKKCTHVAKTFLKSN